MFKTSLEVKGVIDLDNDTLGICIFDVWTDEQSAFTKKETIIYKKRGWDGSGR